MTIGGIIFTAFLLALVGFYVYLIKQRFSSYKEERDEKQHTFVPGDGHKIYELNLVTLEMDEIEAETYETEDGKMRKVVKKKDCLYCTALNEKNAIKRFSKMVPGKFQKA